MSVLFGVRSKKMKGFFGNKGYTMYELYQQESNGRETVLETFKTKKEANEELKRRRKR